MRNLLIVLVAFALLVPATDVYSTTWADIHRIIGVSDTTPEFQNFAARYSLSRRAILADAGLRPSLFCYVSDLGMSVFFDLDGRVSGIKLKSKAVFDPKASFPLGDVPPVRATILASLGLSDAPLEVFGDGTERYKNDDQGVYVWFQGEQFQGIYFYRPKKSQL